jgi:uncharacterized protein (TIGR03382 family)
MRAASAALLAASILGATAHADVAPIPQPGTKFIDFTVEIVGLTDAAGYVVVAWDPPYQEQIERHTYFTPTEGRRAIGWGQSRGNFSKPHFYLMSVAAFEAWQAATAKLVATQREACYQRGEGCVHASRFVAHYPPPPAKDVIDCGVSVEVVTNVPTAGPDHLGKRWQLAEAGPRTCRLTEVAFPAPAPAPTPTPTPAPTPAPAPPATPTSTTTSPSSGCGTAPSEASAAVIVVAAGWLVTRARRKRGF